MRKRNRRSRPPVLAPWAQARQLPGIYTDWYRDAPKVRYDDGSTGMSPEVAIDLLYQDCEPAVALVASVRLRPQQWRLWTEACLLADWPSRPTIALACQHDRILGAEGMIRGSVRASAPLCGHGLSIVEERTIGP